MWAAYRYLAGSGSSHRSAYEVQLPNTIRRLEGLQGSHPQLAATPLQRSTGYIYRTLHPAMSTLPPPQWVVDLTSAPASSPKNPSLPDPPGYTASLTRKERALSSKKTRVPPTPEEMDVLKMKKAWEVAIAPAKQLPMNAFGTPTLPRHHSPAY